jgi:serine/threonine-protein kinase ATR
MIHSADKAINAVREPTNRNAIIAQHHAQLTASLTDRFDTAAPAFRVREAILSMRRTAFSLATAESIKPDIGIAWITSSKVARKAGYEQTAYSATLQAQQVGAPFTFLQQAKLSKMHGGAYKALTELENSVKPLVNKQLKAERNDPRMVSARDPTLAKVRIISTKGGEADDIGGPLRGEVGE